MPALLTSTSTLPSSSAQRFIMRSISAGFDISAPSWIAPSSSHSRSISAASPKPLIISFAPSAASALAIARPIPEVEPVTSATFPRRNMCVSFVALLAGAEANCNRRGARALGLVNSEDAMRFGDERESSNYVDDTGRGGLGFGGGGGNMLGCLIPLIASRFGVGGVLILVIGYFLLSSLGGLGGGGGIAPSTQQVG